MHDETKTLGYAYVTGPLATASHRSGSSFPEVTMLVITDNSPRAELIEAIGHLRTKQRAVFDAEVVAELQVDIDALLDRLGHVEGTAD